MSPVVWRWRLRFYGERLGMQHTRVRAMFGRYVAALPTGIITAGSAGPVAYRAWARSTHSPGYHNRSYRRHHPSP